MPGCEVQRRVGESHLQCSNPCNHEPRDRTLPLKPSHSSACPYSHYSYSKFSSSDLLKTNITEYQQAKLGMCSSSSNPCIPKLFPLAFTGSCPSRGQAIGATSTYIYFSGISFESALRISLLCKISETISVLPSLCSSHFHLQSGKNKPIWCLSLFSHMVRTRLELNQN